MIKIHQPMLLMFLAISLLMPFSAFAQTSTERDSQFVIKIKNKIAEIGTEPNRKVKIRLNDGAKLKGYITEIKDDHFSMFDKTSGKVVDVEYPKVVEVKRDAVPKALKVIGITALATGVVVGILTILGLAAARYD